MKGTNTKPVDSNLTCWVHCLGLPEASSSYCNHTAFGVLHRVVGRVNRHTWMVLVAWEVDGETLLGEEQGGLLGPGVGSMTAVREVSEVKMNTLDSFRTPTMAVGLGVGCNRGMGMGTVNLPLFGEPWTLHSALSNKNIEM